MQYSNSVESTFSAFLSALSIGETPLVEMACNSLSYTPFDSVFVMSLPIGVI